MKAIIKTKTIEEYEKEVLVSEEEFLRELSTSMWLKIENTYENVYLKISEIESIIFNKDNF